MKSFNLKIACILRQYFQSSISNSRRFHLFISSALVCIFDIRSIVSNYWLTIIRTYGVGVDVFYMFSVSANYVLKSCNYGNFVLLKTFCYPIALKWFVCVLLLPNAFSNEFKNIFNLLLIIITIVGTCMNLICISHTVSCKFVQRCAN